MMKSISRAAIFALIAGIAFLANTRDSNGQPATPDVVRIKTVDGLSLWGKWFQGGKGNKSDTVLMVHGYGQQCSKGAWEDLAIALQKEDFSVLMLDLRGHGESAKNRALVDWSAFCEQSYNKLSGYPLNPKANTQEIKREKPFQPGYFPYLINDLAGARRFIDTKNDSGHCNSGRIFIVAEGSISPLIMMAASIEYLRNAVFAAVVGANVPEHPGGRDIAGLIFLSWSSSAMPGHASALTVTNNVWKQPEVWQTKKTVYEQMKDRVSMMWVYSKEDTASAREARAWFTKFGIAGTKKEDTQLRKYMTEVPAEKLVGIKMMDVLVDEKIKKKVNDKEEEIVVKVPIVQQHIISFIKGTVDNGKNGDIHKVRNVATEKLDRVPLELWGLRNP